MHPDRPSYEQLAELVASQAKTIERLESRVQELEAEVKELRARLAKNSRNSSKPPSSDGYAKPPTRSLRRPSGRKPGGQKGHGGHHLERIESPDEVIVHIPRSCEGCGAGLSGAEVVSERSRQVFDLPEVRLSITEHRAEGRRCACGEVTKAPFPKGVSAPAQYGPRLRSLALYLIAHQHLPYERAAGLISDWLGARVSTGTLAAIVERAGEGLGEFTESVREELVRSAVLGVDETGARVEGRLRWVHSASSEDLTLYRLDDVRGHAGIEELGVLREYEGVAVHDGFKPYQAERYAKASHALCNAHHLRELAGVIEACGEEQSWAVQMDALLREIKAAVERAKAQGRSALEPGRLLGFQSRYGKLVALGHRQCPDNTKRTGRRGPIRQSPARNLLGRLDSQREQVLLFASDFRVPFDNNLCERDLRMVKLQQKISGSWRTVAGARRFLALRSYISTTRKQGRDLLDAIGRLAEAEPWLPAPAEP